MTTPFPGAPAPADHQARVAGMLVAVAAPWQSDEGEDRLARKGNLGTLRLGQQPEALGQAAELRGRPDYRLAVALATGSSSGSGAAVPGGEAGIGVTLRNGLCPPRVTPVVVAGW